MQGRKTELAEIAEGLFHLGLGSISGNVYFVGSSSSWALIDASVARREEAIREAAVALFGAGAAPVGILLTHMHPDHCGSARELARGWACPIYIHPRELPLAVDRSLETVERFATPLDLKLILPILRAMPRRKVEAMMERESLAGAARPLPSDGSIPGLEGWISVATPGHTPGHVAFFRQRDRVLVSGDALVTMALEYPLRSLAFALLRAKPRISGPPWYTTWNKQLAKETIGALARLEPRVIASGHGEPMAGESTAGLLYEYCRRWASKN